MQPLKDYLPCLPSMLQFKKNIVHFVIKTLQFISFFLPFVFPIIINLRI